MVLDLPKYMNDVLHFSIQDNGVYSSIPQAIKLVLALLTGALNDWLVAANHMTITNARKVFVAVGTCVCVAFVNFNCRRKTESSKISSFRLNPFNLFPHL